MKKYIVKSILRDGRVPSEAALRASQRAQSHGFDGDEFYIFISIDFSLCFFTSNHRRLTVTLTMISPEKAVEKCLSTYASGSIKGCPSPGRRPQLVVDNKLQMNVLRTCTVLELKQAVIQDPLLVTFISLHISNIAGAFL